jgi:hypothetical protein
MRVLLGLSLFAFIFLSVPCTHAVVSEKLADQKPHLQCESLSENNAICLGGGAQLLDTDAKEAKKPKEVPSASARKASGMVGAVESSGGALDLSNEFEFNTVLGDRTVVPDDPGFSSLQDGQKAYGRIQNVNLLLQATGPGASASKVGIAGKKN